MSYEELLGRVVPLQRWRCAEPWRVSRRVALRRRKGGRTDQGPSQRLILHAYDSYDVLSRLEQRDRRRAPQRSDSYIKPSQSRPNPSPSPSATISRLKTFVSWFFLPLAIVHATRRPSSRICTHVGGVSHPYLRIKARRRRERAPGTCRCSARPRPKRHVRTPLLLHLPIDHSQHIL